MSTPAVTRISTDAPYRSDTVATPEPPLGWIVVTDANDWMQASAELELTRPSGIETHTVQGWDSTRVAWPFAPLLPREDASLRVRVTGTDGLEGTWSEPRRIFAGFLAAREWTATAIGLPDPEGIAQPAVLRTEFDVAGDVVRATLYATAVGVYQAAVNGSDVDDQVMKPGWTPYAARTIHETTDVTALLVPGRNALGIRLAGAWATEFFGFRENARPQYGSQPRVAAQLVIDYADGSSDTVISDESWRVATGPLVASGLYQGETYDARIDVDGFAAPGFDDSAWAAAAPGDAFPAPEARTSPFVRRIQELPVQEVITTPAGKTVLDFGQNLVGGCASASPARPARRSRCATPRSSSTASSARARCGPPLPRTSTRSRGAASRSGSRSSPSTGSATRRSMGGRATSIRPTSPRS